MDEPGRAHQTGGPPPISLTQGLAAYAARMDAMAAQLSGAGGADSQRVPTAQNQTTPRPDTTVTPAAGEAERSEKLRTLRRSDIARAVSIYKGQAQGKPPLVNLTEDKTDKILGGVNMGLGVVSTLAGAEATASVMAATVAVSAPLSKDPINATYAQNAGKYVGNTTASTTTTAFRLLLSVVRAVVGLYSAVRNAEKAGGRRRDAIVRSAPLIVNTLADIALMSTTIAGNYGKASGTAKDVVTVATSAARLAMHGVTTFKAFQAHHQLEKLHEDTGDEAVGRAVKKNKKDLALSNVVPLVTGGVALLAKIGAMIAAKATDDKKVHAAMNVVSLGTTALNAGYGTAMGAVKLVKGMVMKNKLKQAARNPAAARPPVNGKEGPRIVMQKLGELAADNMYIGYADGDAEHIRPEGEAAQQALDVEAIGRGYESLGNYMRGFNVEPALLTHVSDKAQQGKLLNRSIAF